MPSTAHLIPLVSDTESTPTPAMRTAIANAEVGDEQRGEDPTVNRLQARVAELLDKDAALWFPGGTMCNFVAIKVHTQPADAVVDWMAHIIRAESAGVAFSSSVQFEPVITERGIFSGDELRIALERLGTAPMPWGLDPASSASSRRTTSVAGRCGPSPSCRPSRTLREQQVSPCTWTVRAC